jgi:hypothetical protein
VPYYYVVEREVNEVEKRLVVAVGKRMSKEKAISEKGVICS